LSNETLFNNKMFKTIFTAILADYVTMPSRFPGMIISLINVEVCFDERTSPSIMGVMSTCLRDHLLKTDTRPLLMPWLMQLNIGRNDICPCGSGSKLRRFETHDFVKTASLIIRQVNCFFDFTGQCLRIGILEFFPVGEITRQIDWCEDAEEDNNHQQDSNKYFWTDLQILFKMSRYPTPVENQVDNGQKDERKAEHPVQVSPVVPVNTQDEVFF
jgi:hypothetical protein